MGNAYSNTQYRQYESSSSSYGGMASGHFSVARPMDWNDMPLEDPNSYMHFDAHLQEWRNVRQEKEVEILKSALAKKRRLR